MILLINLPIEKCAYKFDQNSEQIMTHKDTHPGSVAQILSLSYLLHKTMEACMSPGDYGQQFVQKFLILSPQQGDHDLMRMLIGKLSNPYLDAPGAC